MSEDNDGPCLMCIVHDNPSITNSELRTMGATTDRMCTEHQAAFDAFNRSLNDAYRNTRGADA